MLLVESKLLALRHGEARLERERLGGCALLFKQL